MALEAKTSPLSRKFTVTVTKSRNYALRPFDVTRISIVTTTSNELQIRRHSVHVYRGMGRGFKLLRDSQCGEFYTQTDFVSYTARRHDPLVMPTIIQRNYTVYGSEIYTDICASSSSMAKSSRSIKDEYVQKLPPPAPPKPYHQIGTQTF